MRHPREELISALVDGRLDVGETRRVAAHLHGCVECRSLLAEFERNKIRFRSMEKPEQPEQAFWDDTFRKMRTMGEVETARTSVWDSFRVSRRQWQAAFAAAACVVVAVVVPLSTHVRVVSPPPGPISAATASDDTIDSDDVSTFVRAHTESAAYQPLGDPDRQQMIAAEADGMHPDVAEAATDADVSP
jgi:anti-sigma factor RsiW